MGAEALSPGIKWQGSEADHSLPSSSKDKNDDATSMSPLPHAPSWLVAYLIKHRATSSSPQREDEWRGATCIPAVRLAP
jgi:hypothetical protein